MDCLSLTKITKRKCGCLFYPAHIVSNLIALTDITEGKHHSALLLGADACASCLYSSILPKEQSLYLGYYFVTLLFSHDIDLHGDAPETMHTR